VAVELVVEYTCGGRNLTILCSSEIDKAYWHNTKSILYMRAMKLSVSFINLFYFFLSNVDFEYQFKFDAEVPKLYREKTTFV
jgi:hypothetical protein